jgi:hypothetical protein
MSEEQPRNGPEGQPNAGQPSPFSREGAGDDHAADGPAAPLPSDGWPSYPPIDDRPADPPAAPTSYPASPYETPYSGPYGTPSANPAGPPTPPPGFDPQPTTPYGASNVGQGYQQPPTQSYGDQAQGYGGPAQGYGANPYEVNPYQPAYGGYNPYGMAPTPHPKANTALIFGIIGLVLAFFTLGVGGLLGIGGIINGRTARAEIDADPQRYTGRSAASAGYGLGITGVVLFSLFIVLFIISLASGLFNG